MEVDVMAPTKVRCMTPAESGILTLLQREFAINKFDISTPCPEVNVKEINIYGTLQKELLQLLTEELL